MPSRRLLLGVSLAAAGTALHGLSAAAHELDETSPTAREALSRLLDGNTRWVSGRLAHRDPAAQRRRRVADAQHPFAVVIGCIDSRVTPEYVFDQDLGDLFVVRIGGQAVDPLVLGSVEYGPAHGVPLVFVLGHTGCGAVRATVESFEDGVRQPGHLSAVVAALAPAYRAAVLRPGMSREQRVDAVVAAQVGLTVAALRRDRFLAGAQVAGGVYQLSSGVVVQTGSTPAGSPDQAAASVR